MRYQMIRSLKVEADLRTLLLQWDQSRLVCWVKTDHQRESPDSLVDQLRPS